MPRCVCGPEGTLCMELPQRTAGVREIARMRRAGLPLTPADGEALRVCFEMLSRGRESAAVFIRMHCMECLRRV